MTGVFKRTAYLVLGVVWTLAWSSHVRAQDVPARARPKAYGTSQDSIYHLSIKDFAPRNAGTLVEDMGIPGVLARYATNCIGYCFEAVPRLPDGALLTGIEAYFCNTDPDVNHELSIDVAKALYDGTDVTDLFHGVSSATHNGCGEFRFADLTSLNYQVNYYNNQLILYAVIDTEDGSQAIAGVNLYYRLQVSPAPQAADFNDVPTNHPFFQFVEALYASGITAGCGSGNYCPDAPLTRGQMAVFLSKALGLQWQ
jgi:S-layer homology domain